MGLISEFFDVVSFGGSLHIMNENGIVISCVNEWPEFNSAYEKDFESTYSRDIETLDRDYPEDL